MKPELRDGPKVSVKGQMKVQGSVLTRNTVFNLTGNIVPLIFGIVTIPYLIKMLGVESFGILSMAWVILGYFSLFDLGIGRATTKFIAEKIGEGLTDKIPPIIWTSFCMHFLLGLLGSIIFASLTERLVNEVFNVSPALIKDAEYSFLVLAASVPIILASTVLRGVIEAAQRFDLVNVIKIPANSLVFLLPALGVSMGLSLPGIIVLIMAARLGTVVAYLLLCFRVFPNLRKKVTFDSSAIRPLISYGSWITITNIVSPVLMYSDRFIIGSFLSMAAVAYYATPYEALARVWIIPSSLAASLFPTFSASRFASGKALSGLYTRSVKYLLLVVGPVTILLIAFAGEILRLWLGAEFAQKSTSVFQVLAVGILFNSLAFVPYVFLQGAGRPDIPAKLHLLELVICLPVTWFLVKRMGITGGALASTLRACIDAVLLFGAGWRLYRLAPGSSADDGFLKCAILFLLFSLIVTGTLFAGLSMFAQASMIFTLLICFGLITWRYALNTKDRDLLGSIVRKVA